MYNSSGRRVFEVRLGATRLDVNEPGSVVYTSTNAIVHPEYSQITLANDVAIILLTSGPAVTGENCHNLIHVKLVFLTHESYCLHFLLHRTL
jgi:hypothetical protein